MAQIKNATNEIKSEISNSAKDSGIDMNSLTGGISDEIAKAKAEIKKTVHPMDDISNSIENPIQQAKEDIESLTGPIKRQG